MTALTVRRIAAKAALAGMGLLAVAGLSACRVESGAALFVQDERVSEQYVDDVVESAPDGIEAAGIEIGQVRQHVVQQLAIAELAEQIAAESGAPLPGPDYTGAAKTYGSDSTNEFVQVTARGDAYLEFLLTAAPTVTATDADVEALVSRLNAPAEDLAQTTAIVSASLTSPLNQAAFSRYATLDRLVTEHELLANPRYGEIGISAADLLIIDPANGQPVIDPNTGQPRQLPLVVAIPTTAT